VLIGCYINGILYGDTSFTTSVLGDMENYRFHYRLEQNYPNPFNPTTTISYYIPKSGYVKIIVFDVRGRGIVIIVDKYHQAGNYKIVFDTEKYTGLASGVYFYRIFSDSYTETKKMIYLR
jgi:hypothetical protein